MHGRFGLRIRPETLTAPELVLTIRAMTLRALGFRGQGAAEQATKRSNRIHVAVNRGSHHSLVVCGLLRCLEHV
jgi:hypothetical protein